MKDAVKLIVYDAHGDVLVLRRSNTHPYWPLNADFPGGDIDPGETAVQAAVRELHEETGLVVSHDQLELIESWSNHYGTQHHLYEVRLPERQPSILISWEHDEHTWFVPTDISRHIHPALTDKFTRSIVKYFASGE